jgi:hypothetical protein
MNLNTEIKTVEENGQRLRLDDQQQKIMQWLLPSDPSTY